MTTTTPRRVLASSTLALLTIMASALPVGVLGDGNEACPSTPDPHPPISILGDSGFALPASGVRAGSGSEEDPYLICGWEIVPQSVDGILLKDTTAHVVIRNNYIHGALAAVQAYVPELGSLGDQVLHAGIHLRGASHVAVEENRVLDNRPILYVQVLCECTLARAFHGVSVQSSADVTIHRNDIARNAGIGIRVSDSTGASADQNTVASNAGGGILGWHVPGFQVSANVLTGNGFASISVGLSPDAAVVGNSVTGGTSGVSVAFATPRASVVGNSIDRSVTGVELLYAHEAHISGNNITNSSRDGVNTHGSRNQSLSGNRIVGSVRDGIYASAATNLTVRDNDILDSGRDGTNVTNNSNVTLRNNNIVGNSEHGVHSMGRLVDARENWWGCAEGPGAAGCDGVTQNVLYDPWLTEPAP